MKLPAMRLPTRLHAQHPVRKIIAAIAVAGAATLLALLLHRTPGVSVAMSGLDDTLYDAFYQFRKPEDRTTQPIVIITVDEESIKKLNQTGREWPWSRDIWAATVQYMQACGAKAVVFDIQFQDKRNFDKEFGAALDAATIPVILATQAQPDGRPDAFAPKVKRAMNFAATNILDARVARRYPRDVHGLPSLAVAAAAAAGAPAWPCPQNAFLLRYFGPHQRPDGRTTYNYLSAYRACKAAAMPNHAKDVGISPDMFRGKIVLIGGTATGTFDLKSSPLSPIYPGVEVHATAIDDLLTGQIVQPVGEPAAAIAALLAAALASLGAVLPRRVTLKILFAAIAWGLLAAFAIFLFIAHAIHWLPMATPLVALLVATVGAFAWSYLTEDRQRRFVLKALSQYLSPAVAAEISRNPDSLKLGGERRDMTVLFSDIQGFTDLSESMPSENLSAMLNYYLGEMSGVILTENGTLDKYIGDAIMSFWNAPLLQPNHAELACRAALAMRHREAQIQPELAAYGAPGLLTRIGINTGPMVVGNMGSAQKFNFSVLGDSVNLGSRLEGANKFYGSQILISETTAADVKDAFVLRHLDVLRVKGKQKPLAVYELLAEGKADPEMARQIEQYAEAFALYQGQNWDAATIILNRLHEQCPEDRPVAALLKRIAKLRQDPPGEGWDGVYVAKDK